METLLRDYFGFSPSPSALSPEIEAILRLLKSDPGFSISDLTETDLAKLMARLHSLVEEDLHFGSSAVWALYEMLVRHCEEPGTGDEAIPCSEIASALLETTPRNDDPNLKAFFRKLTILLLFTDILTGVVSPEFVGNLQFSAYAMKVVAEAVTTPVPGSAGTAKPGTGALKLVGVRISWEEILALISAGNHVMVSIEDRHFVVVTSITGTACAEGTGSGVLPVPSACTVTFLENGFTRTISAQEFTARWFGVALIDQSVIASPQGEAISDQWRAKVLKTSELLKIKGAGWWKRLWKKIKKFFQAVARAVVKVVKKVVQAVQKFFASTAGKIIGMILLGPAAFALLNFAVNSASYLLNGDFKGLFKYWGSNWIQIVAMALQAIPVLGQILGGLLQAVGGFLQAVGGFLAGLGSALGGALSAIPLVGPVLGGLVRGALHFAGGFLEGLGGSLIAQGRALMGKNSFFQDLKSRGFEAVRESLRNGFDRLIDQLNPLTHYQNFMKSVTDHVTKSVSSFSRFMGNVLEQVGTQIAIQQIDQSLEKTKMNSFLKSILSTVSSAGIQAIGRSVADGLGSFVSQIGQALGIRGPPTNQPRVLQYNPGDEDYYLFGSDGKPNSAYFNLENDPFGLGPLPVDFSLQGEGITYGLDENGIPLFAQLLGTGRIAAEGNIEYAVSRNPDGVSFRTDEGDLYESRRDPITGRYQAPYEIRLPSNFSPFDPSLEAINGPLSAAWIARMDKIRKGVTALGVRLENFSRPVVNELGEIIGQREYTKVFGSKAAREAAGFKLNANVFRSTTQAVAKYTDVVTAARVAARNALIVGVAINIVDDLSVGIANGQSRSQIASNIIIDSGITLVSNVIGAIAGVAAFPTLPGANILVGVGVSYGISEFLKARVDRLGWRENLTNLINQGVSIFNQSRSAIDLRDDRWLLDTIRWDSLRRYYGFF